MVILINGYEKQFVDILRDKYSDRSSRSQLFFKIGFLKNFAVLQEKTCTGVKAWNPATLLKGDSNTGVFLWILQNF